MSPGPRYDSVWDAGLQPERTNLAWQRTTMALLSAGLIVARLVGHHQVIGGIVIAATSVLLAAGIGLLGSRGYAGVQHNLRARVPLGHGPINLLLLWSFLVVGIGAMAYAALAATR
jgi:uncharacterized membrane protein YidH (DUF202 family)